MGTEEESYLLLQILQKLFKLHRKDFPSTYQQQLDELSKKNLPNRYTLEVEKLTVILMSKDDLSDFVIEPCSDLYDLDLETLHNYFHWSNFLHIFIHYMCKGIIQVCDTHLEHFTKLYRGLLQVLEHHKEKGTLNYSWKELKKLASSIVEDHERHEREQIEAEILKKSTVIREFVLRIIDYVYKLMLVDLPPELQKMLNEFPNNSHECLLDSVEEAISLLLNDPELATKVDEIGPPNDVTSLLKIFVYRSKVAALKYWEEQKSDFSLEMYEYIMKEFKELQELMPLNLLWWHVKFSARDIAVLYNGSCSNGKTSDSTECKEDKDVDLLNSNTESSDTQQLVDDPSPDNDSRKMKCCCFNF